MTSELADIPAFLSVSIPQHHANKFIDFTTCYRSLVGCSFAALQPQVVAPPKPAPQPSSITSQTPENVIGETLVVQGRIEFQNLLRIDGHFEVRAQTASRSG